MGCVSCRNIEEVSDMGWPSLREQLRMDEAVADDDGRKGFEDFLRRANCRDRDL